MQQRFAREYAACGNASEAARRAGYSTKNAGSIAKQLLQKTPVREEAQKRQIKVLQKADVDGDRVVKEWAWLGTSNIAELLDGDGRVLPIHDLPEHAQAAISSIEFDDEGYVRKIRLWDKPAALRDMARYYKLLTPERLNVNILNISVTTEQLARMGPVERLEAARRLLEEAKALEAECAAIAARHISQYPALMDAQKPQG